MATLIAGDNGLNVDASYMTLGYSVASATTTQIVLRVADSSMVAYLGQFSYTNGYLTGGVLTGQIEYGPSGALVAQVSGIHVPYSVYMQFSNVRDGTGLVSYEFSGSDLMRGGAGVDLLRGYIGDDTMYGGGNVDILYGNQGNDALYGEVGPDTMFGGQGADYLAGGADADVIYGNMDADTIYGGDADDTIFGGQGDDRILGEAGNDVLAGNLGADRFVFAAGQGHDQIRGFNADQGDRIELAAGMTYATGAASDGSTILALSGGGTVTVVGIAPTTFISGWVVS